MAPTWARALHTIISFSLALTEQPEQTAQATAEAAFAFSIWSLTFSLCVRCKLKNHRASAAEEAIEINNRHRCHLVAGSVLLPSKLILRQRTANCFRQASASAAATSAAAAEAWYSSTEVAASPPPTALSGSRGSIGGTKHRIFWHAEANKFLAAAATAASLVVIAADAKSCLLNSGNGNANSHTKGQSVRGEKERESVSVETEQERESNFERGCARTASDV